MAWGYELWWRPAAVVLSLYPILGAVAWTVGGLFYRFFYVGKFRQQDFVRMAPQDEPFVTIMIPAHNEEVMIEETIDYLMNDLDYHNYEVLVCDDGSKDTTPDILERLSLRYPRLRVLRIEANQGKAHAFNIGVAFARGEYILSNDADTVPERDALWKYLNYFLSPAGQNIGAVTANMDVQNRSLLVEKSQTVEFSSIVGIIKRSQIGVLGSMYAYSGANTMYRRDALYDVGLFRQDRATEDISICWDQQYAGWKADFAPDIMFYMNVPNTLTMLYHQRRRWAKGGTESWLTNVGRVVRHPLRNVPKVVLLLDQTGSIVWSLYYLLFSLWLAARLVLSIVTGNTEDLFHTVDIVLVFSAVISLVGWWQLVAALALDNHGAKLRYLLFAPAYMVWYWQMNAITVATTLVPAVRGVLGYSGKGTWVSPVRTRMTAETTAEEREDELV
ncbi:glycosyltransferase [Xylanimonas protaetiae]|uniref:Glycosyltransferase n=1 Tax=Xylanimonas protaetiae TaxID=2509457 RepID=A0A4P6FBT2_9MICO|nr:glycosyltransferase [Xylanimonas protaetiae]